MASSLATPLRTASSAEGDRPGTVGRDKLIAARAGRSVPAPTMGAPIDGTPAPRLFAASPTEWPATWQLSSQLGRTGCCSGWVTSGSPWRNSAVTDVSLTLSEGQFSGQSAGGSASLCCPVWPPARRALSRAGYTRMDLAQVGESRVRDAGCRRSFALRRRSLVVRQPEQPTPTRTARRCTLPTSGT